MKLQEAKFMGGKADKIRLQTFYRQQGILYH